MSYYYENTVPDCLVLKLEELEECTNEIDTTMYIFYDKNEHHYVIRGQRRVTEKCNSCVYSFVCNDALDLIDFLSFIFDEKFCVLNITLYNYDNLSNNSNDITYEFLQDYDHRDYELAGYDGQDFDRKQLLNCLRMIRNVFNYNN